MPNTKSAKKRMRQNTRRRAQNRKHRSAVRSAVKKVRAAASADEAEAAYREAERLLDRAAGKKLVAKNTAARQKRRLAKAAREKSTK
ncbi:MAG: 30S ribosomal protein S20 [Gemmatimonadota bacterium]|nr:MAG: 30S ribosomal protein S20 [Gemmatimonadota bacterium]